MYEENILAHNWLAKRLLNRAVIQRIAHLHGTVVDLGCGTRPFAKEILAKADCYIGVDWTNCLHRSNVDLIADLNEPLPLADTIADHVTSFEVLEHLCEPTLMLAEAKRILRPSGTLVLSCPFQWWIHEAPWDYFRYTCHGLKYMLTRAGFQDISIVPTSGFWSMWILKLNYQLTRLVRGPRPVRIAVKAFLIPFWWLGQTIAPMLDRCWPEDRETAGYFVTARKP